jgi:hypothetical protein
MSDETCPHGYPEKWQRHCAQCLYDDEMRDLYARNRQLRDILWAVYQAARNDVNRWDGGVCVGTQRFSDRLFARRLVAEIEPLVYPVRYENSEGGASDGEV